MTNLRPHSTTVSVTAFESADSGSNPDVAATPITDALREGAAKANMTFKEYWRHIVRICTIEIEP